MTNMLAYRIGHPRKPAVPLERLRPLGVTCVEIGIGDDDPAEIKALLARHGLRATTLTSACPMAEDKLFDVFERACSAAKKLGCTAVFTSVKTGEMPAEQVWERLRRIGETATRHGMKIGMETHPPLCENGARALATMAAVRHPGIGINYDTANVYYYNEGVDTVAELGKIARHVVSVHLKDSFGGFRQGGFPVFGKGIVDFRGVFNLLNGLGFTGPFTMELEGKATSSPDPVVQEGYVRACVEHLRGLGLVA